MGIESPKDGITGGCKLPNVGAGKQTLVLYKCSN